MPCLRMFCLEKNRKWFLTVKVGNVAMDTSKGADVMGTDIMGTNENRL